MEITARPAPDAGRRKVLVRILIAVTILVAVALIAPAAVGLQRHVVADGETNGTYATGSIVFDELVPVEQLRIGDVVSFPTPMDAGEHLVVTRRIVEIRGDQLVTRGDALAGMDPWLLRVDGPGVARVAFVVPWLGYPWLLATGAGPVGWLLAGVVAMAGLALLRFRRHLPRGAARTTPAVASRPTSPGEPATLG